MKTHIILIPLALAALLSCQKETDTSPVGLPMRVVPTIDGTTKASLTTADLQEFWLNVDCPSDAAFSYCGKVSKSGTAWSAGKQLYWKNETAPVNYSAAFFSGHDFSKAEFTSGAALSVPADQSTQAGLNAADLLTLKATSTTYEATTGGALPVELKHGLAKLTVVLSLGSDFYDNRYGRTANPVTAFTIAGTNLGFNFQPATGAVTVTASTAADITPFAISYAPGTATSKTSVATYEAILVPQTIAVGDLTITFSVGANDYAWTNTDALTLSAGQSAKLPMSVTTAPPPPSINGHEYVDMGEVTIGGVTKHLLWATCNIGADNPWDYGDYFAWGEPATKTYFDWDSYSLGDGTTFSKYSGSDYATLQSEDDAATAIWGGDWRIPIDKEWDVLLGANYNWVWTTDYLGSGKNGMLVTRNDDGSGTDPCAGNSIFLPATGSRYRTYFYGAGSDGYYWSSSLETDDPDSAWLVCIYSNNAYMYNEYRRLGFSVRPVSD